MFSLAFSWSWDSGYKPPHFINSIFVAVKSRFTVFCLENVKSLLNSGADWKQETQLSCKWILLWFSDSGAVQCTNDRTMSSPTDQFLVRGLIFSSFSLNGQHCHLFKVLWLFQVMETVTQDITVEVLNRLEVKAHISHRTNGTAPFYLCICFDRLNRTLFIRSCVLFQKKILSFPFPLPKLVLAEELYLSQCSGSF